MIKIFFTQLFKKDVKLMTIIMEIKTNLNQYHLLNIYP
jgi:hypothetical protein